MFKSRRINGWGMQLVWGREEVHTGFWWGNVSGRDHLEDPGADGRIILNGIFMKWDVSMDWLDVSHDGDRWWAFVKAVMNLRVPKCKIS
jgi:hypothetical protein